MADDDRGSDGETDDDEEDDDDEDEDEENEHRQYGSKLNACPNLRNPYHECTPFCSKKWGTKPFSPDKGLWLLMVLIDLKLELSLAELADGNDCGARLFKSRLFSLV